MRLYEVKTLQIMPADGWFAMFATEEETWTNPIACFALIEYESMGKVVRDVVPLEVVDNSLEIIDDMESFDMVRADEERYRIGLYKNQMLKEQERVQERAAVRAQEKKREK